MSKYKFNEPLKLINKKPKGEEMIENGYGFYMYPSLVMSYINDNKVLTDRERRLYLAISGQAEKDRNGKPCHWAIKHYCEIANIGNNHYSEVLDSLCKKGFVKHTNFQTIEVLYPISETEAISPNGKIVKRESSQNGKSANNNQAKIFSPKKEDEQTQNGNNYFYFGNNYSQVKANNKEINKFTNNIYKEQEKESSQDWEDFGEEKKQSKGAKSKDLI